MPKIVLDYDEYRRLQEMASYAPVARKECCDQEASGRCYDYNGKRTDRSCYDPNGWVNYWELPDEDGND